jgi:urease accessory protein
MIWQGQLNLEYTYQAEKTILSKAFFQSPLKVQRPFYPEGQPLCHTVMLHTAGGIVGGDRLLYQIQCHPEAQSLLTTATAGKVYRSNGQWAYQTVEINLAEKSYLEWLPQETIIFNQACYQQDLRVNLAPQSVFLGWEIQRLGRTAREEQFLEGEWRSRWEIWQNQQPLWIDRQRLVGNENTVNAPNTLNKMPILGTLIWQGIPLQKKILEQAQGLTHELRNLGKIGLTLTQNEGLVCRYRGDSTQEIYNIFRQLWSLLRFTYRHQTAIKPRVWSV